VNNVGTQLHAVHNGSGQTTVDGEMHNCNVSGVTSSNTVNLVLIEGGGGWKVTGCHFWKSGSTMLSLQQGYGSIVSNNVFEGPAEDQTTGTHYNIDLGNSQNRPIAVTGNVGYQNVVNAAVRGFLYVGNSGSTSPLVTITGNNYRAGAATDIFCHLQGDNGGTIYAQITGNFVTTSTKYIDVGGATYPMQDGNSWQTIDGATPPASGTYVQGTRIWRRDAATGAAPGWVATSSGAPPTWKAMANLA
jgi:hypothetical protein